MARTTNKGQGVSFLPTDAQQVGLWQGGRSTITFLFGLFDYGPRGKHPALIVTFTDEHGEAHEEPYGVGKGWAISADGSELIPKQGQTGFPTSCDAIKYLLGPLAQVCDAAGGTLPGGSDITALDGVVAEVKRVPVEARVFADDRRRKEDENKEPKTKITVTEVFEMPWADDAAPAKKGKASKAKAKANDDDDDEDEAPAKKGKAAPADDDDSGVDDSATEALIEALEDEDGPLAIDEIESTLLTALKGNPERKAIAARAADEDFLATEDGWKVNKKKGTVALA
jgi:hypothetical protein